MPCLRLPCASCAAAFPTIHAACPHPRATRGHAKHSESCSLPARLALALGLQAPARARNTPTRLRAPLPAWPAEGGGVRKGGRGVRQRAGGRGRRRRPGRPPPPAAAASRRLWRRGAVAPPATDAEPGTARRGSPHSSAVAALARAARYYEALATALRLGYGGSAAVQHAAAALGLVQDGGHVLALVARGAAHHQRLHVLRGGPRRAGRVSRSCARTGCHGCHAVVHGQGGAWFRTRPVAL